MLRAFVVLVLAARFYEMPFWPGKSPDKDARYLRTEDHPCGKVIYARVTAFPRGRKGSALIPEIVVELGAKGKVIRRWPIPVDATPLGVRAESLLLNTEGRRLWVTPEGVIAPYHGRGSLPPSAVTGCATPSDFNRSPFRECRKFRDLNSGKVRWLSFQGPCT
jgi:hypothetical protein